MRVVLNDGYFALFVKIFFPEVKIISRDGKLIAITKEEKWKKYLESGKYEKFQANTEESAS